MRKQCVPGAPSDFSSAWERGYSKACLCTNTFVKHKATCTQALMYIDLQQQQQKNCRPEIEVFNSIEKKKRSNCHMRTN